MSYWYILFNKIINGYVRKKDSVLVLKVLSSVEDFP
jgi:pentatricopeptide repeat protein